MSQEKFEQAISYFKAGNKKQASELLLEIVDVEPINVDAWFGLALCTDDLEKKKYFLKKVLEIKPLHSKASQLLEEINSTSTAKTPDPIKKQNFPLFKVITSILIGVLVLCVAWLFSKVYILEKTLTQTQTELASTIDTLSYVQSLAENADRYAHSHNNFSDNRLKVNISPLKDPLQGVLSLNGVTFYWNTSDYPELGLNNDPQVGFIAQELEKIYPELVHTDENGYKTVDYVKLIPILTEAIKQQQLMITDLQKEITELRNITK